MDSFVAFRQRLQSRAFAGLPEQVARLDWSADQIAGRQLAQLQALLAHAIGNAPFHAARLKGLDPDRLRLEDLRTLPVMTKAEMMDRFDEATTDRRLTRGHVEQTLAATGQSPIPLFDRYIAYASGGSSGVRGVFVWDEAGLADLFCSLRRAALRQASAAPPAGPTVMVGAASAVHVTGSAPALTAGTPDVFLSVPATLPLHEIVDRLNRLQPGVLYGYPSIVARLAREQADGRLAIAPRLVTVSSETLTPEHRAVIRATFGVPIVNTFGSSEGLVGHSAPDGEALTFNSDMCIVELVDEAYRPVPPGTPSAKVLLTNLANRLQPLIRYELNDRFVEVENAASGHLTALVEGRADDVLRYAALAVHPHAITSVMVRWPQVADYQVRQTPRGLEVAVLASGGADLAGLAAALRASFARAGLADPEVAVRAVAALPQDARTGKLRRIVPLAAELTPAIG